jgi:hypothetical protein
LSSVVVHISLFFLQKYDKGTPICGRALEKKSL